MATFMASGLLPCHYPERYYLNADKHYDSQCIAPVSVGRQCLRNIGARAAGEVLRLIANLDSLPLLGQQEQLEALALQRCCGQHRKKLEANGDALRQIGARYARIWSDALQTTPTGGECEPHTSSALRCQSSRSSSYSLRSHKADTHIKDGKGSCSQAGDLTFVPFPSTSKHDIKSILRTQVPDSYSSRGYVYAFTWPQTPGFVKIGYTKDVAGRMQKWRSCFSGAELLCHIEVDFPRRVESLIHTELNGARHQVVICPSCGRSHHEWFRISKSKAAETLNSWKRAMDELRPFGSDGKTLAFGGLMLNGLGNELTAKQLLDVSGGDASSRQRAEKRQEQEWSLAKSTGFDSSLFLPSVQVAEARKLGRILRKMLRSQDWDMLATYFLDFWRLV